MHVLKKIFLFFILTLLVFSFGCTLNPGEADDNDNTPPVISTPSDDDDKPVVTDPQDNVTFVNKTDLMVKIFSDSLKTNLLTEINYGEKFSCKADVNTVGNVFYYTYYLALDKVLIPYGTGQGIVNLSIDKSTTVNIVDPTEINTNKNIVILKNLSSSAISLGYSTSELLAENMTSTLLNQDEYGIYLLDFSNNLADYKIFDAGKNINLSETPTEEKGYIYYFDYTGKEVVLNSKTFLDKAINDKIWKISLSQEAGKTLLAGHFTTRKKSENGYMLLGRIAYSPKTTNIAVPYYTLINTYGNITEENSFSFKDNPLCTKFKGFAENNDNIILVLGEKEDEKEKGTSFIISDFNGYSIYKDIVTDDSENKEYYKPFEIIHKKDNIFCILLEHYILDNDGNTSFNGYQLIEITVDDYDSVTTKKIYESDENALRSPCSFTYDNITDTYVVLSQFFKPEGGIANTNSLITFIDGATGTKKSDLEITNYLFNKIKFNPEDGHVYSSGSFSNQLTGKDEASFAKIDVTSASVVDNKPVKYPCNNKSLNSNFNDFVFDGDNILLCGSSGADYPIGCNEEDKNAKGWYPYIVSHNTKLNKTNWEKEYKDITEFTIYTVTKSAINSLLLEIYNNKSSQSYIVSAGILGEIPEEIKLTLPQSSSIKDVEAPDVTVYLYENFDATDDYAEATFKFGDEITLEDLAKYVPADIPTGYTITGWNKWGADTEDEAITFPYTIEDSPLRFYPKLEQGKTDINCDASKLAETIAGLSAGEYKIIVSGTMTSDILAAVKTAMIDNESAKINLDLSGTTGLTTISDFAFQNCGNLISIIIPESVTSIDNNAFQRCANLTSVTIPDSVFFVDGYAFLDCENLESVTFEDTKNWYYTSTYGGTKEIDVTDPTQNATDFKSGKYNDKYLIKTANVYSYKLNIEDISGTWGGTTKSPMFSIIFMTDEQVEASKNYGDFNFSSQAYQIFSYANMKIADTNQTGDYAVYGSLPVDDEYQYYTGVAATVTDTTFELLLDVSKLKKTEIKWFNSENASGEMLTDSDTLDLSDYKPYVIALGTEINDPDNYVMTVWGADIMTMTPSPTSFPTYLEYAAPKVPTCYDLTHIAGNATIDETGEWKHISLDDNSYEFTYTYYGTDEYGDVYDAFKFTNGSWEFQVGGANITALNTEFKLEESQNVGNITFDDGLLTVGRKYTISLIVKDIHEAYVKVDITPTTVYVSDIVNTISTLPAGEHTLAVSGTMDASILSNIASAMKKNTSAMIALDFSNTTGLTAIKNDTFLDCSNITSIVIPNGVTSIGNVAFTNCKSLASVTIPESVTSIAQGQFRLCPNLTCFNVSENNENFSTSDDGKILYSKGKTILIAYPSATGDITIPDGVIEMTWGAFYNCTNITSVTIPDSMIYICDWVFYNCDGLTNIIIPDSVTLIGDSAFSGCSNLKNVTIGEGVTLISYRAFYNCTNLTSVTFKDTSTWYYTDTERSQGGRVLSREEGTQIGVTNPTRNATNLKSTYCEYWWYKR